MEQVNAIYLVARFQRCRNYPRSDEELGHMAEALERASDKYGIPMQTIVSECLDASEWCPTDADLMNVAAGIRGPEKAEDLPAPRSEEVRRGWHAFVHQFPQIMENGRLWEKDFAEVCAKVRGQMGMKRWMETTSVEKVQVALEMGMPILHQDSKYRIEECGLGAFVRRRKLTT